MKVEEFERIKRASTMRFNGDEFRTAQTLYSLGQLLSERAKVAEFILKDHTGDKELRDHYQRYNDMLKQYLSIS